MGECPYFSTMYSWNIMMATKYFQMVQEKNTQITLIWQKLIFLYVETFHNTQLEKSVTNGDFL